MKTLQSEKKKKNNQAFLEPKPSSASLRRFLREMKSCSRAQPCPGVWRRTCTDLPATRAPPKELPTAGRCQPAQRPRGLLCPPGAAVPPAGPAPLWETAIFCSTTPTGRCGGAEPGCGCCGVTNKSAAPSLPLPRAWSLR